MRNIITTALCLAISACGGGGGGSPSAQPAGDDAPAYVPRDVTPDMTVAITVALYGDSLLNLEAAKLRLLLPNAQVLNHAIPGLRLQSLAVVDGEPATVDVIGFGTNDARANPENPSAEQFQAELTAAVTRQQKAGHRVVIQTPPRTTNAITRGWTYSDGVARFAAAARAVAEQTGETLCDRFEDSQSWPDSAYLPDGMHYADATQPAAILAECIKAAIR